MQILDKAITPNGIEIELHDLSGEHRLPDYNGMIINFCTVEKNTFPPNKGWYSQKGKEFRSCIYSFGKYTEDNGKLTLPLTLTMAHAALDGWHTSEFSREMQEELEAFSI